MSTAFLPYGRQTIEDDDIAAVVEALRGDFLTTGPLVPRFEGAFAQKVGAAHAIACANGTAALHLATMAAGLGAGDCAVVPAVTFLATANVVRMTGAEVILADVDPDSGVMTAQSLDEAMSRADRPVKAIMPVHLAGQSVDMAGMEPLALRANATIIEDACHAIGATSRLPASEVEVGACRHGGYAAFSLHPVKTITTGEGGVVTTADPAAARRLALLRSHGMVKEPEHLTEHDLAFAADGAVNPWYYEMPDIGWNYRLTDVQAALGISQLSKLDRFLERRQHLRNLYATRLAELRPLVRLSPDKGYGRPAWHLAAVLIEFAEIGIDRAEIMRRLRRWGVGSQVHYIPLHLQPYYRRRYGRISLPGAEAWYRRCLSLPLYPAMQDSDVERICSALEAAVTRW